MILLSHLIVFFVLFPPPPLPQLKGIGYKFKEFENIEEGQTLMLGGKEVEVMGVISPDDFNSGRCFQLGGGSADVPSTSQTARKCFSNPFKGVCKPSSKENRRSDFQKCKPRHNPYTPSKILKIISVFLLI